MLKIVAHRVDALTLAFRVELDAELVDELRAKAKIAKKHGRAAFTWRGITAELRFARADGLWRLVNKLWRLQIDPRAAGGGELRDCSECRGMGCARCGDTGTVTAPGWTVEIIWSAVALADRGLRWCLDESSALARTLGTLLEQRLRRIDLCADVAGWSFHADDSRRLLKRPQALWAHRDVLTDDDEVDRAWRKDVTRELETAAVLYGKGSLRQRRITGLDVGRGGNLMCRMYDKRVELSRSVHHEDDRLAEESRWRDGGWDGEAPVTRVEFQLRGVVLAEMGLRDPDAPLEPIVAAGTYTDKNGRRCQRKVVTGHRLVEVSGRQATLVDRLPDIWRLCTEWVRLVAPTRSRNGTLSQACRWKDDQRWAKVRAIAFGDVTPKELRRYRPRAAASSAQALGITLSQAGKEGRLVERDVRACKTFARREPERAAAYLRAELVGLKLLEADRIFRALLTRWGNVEGAWEHFTIRTNAAIARFSSGEGGHDVTEAFADDCRDGPSGRARKKAAVSARACPALWDHSQSPAFL